ncbi:hypothetical protein DL96DRAFT_1598197 [Flagelloscypha sp. PMI_526]|nr:hypothetical protein DL96DRAFT_1598197 [Flagelloscypha sp. PMI_526]
MSYRDRNNAGLLPGPVNERTRPGASIGFRISPKRIIFFAAIALAFYLFLSRPHFVAGPRKSSVLDNLSHTHNEGFKTFIEPPLTPVATVIDNGTPSQITVEEIPVHIPEQVEPAHHLVPYRSVRPQDFTLPDLASLPSDAILTFIPYTFSYPMLVQTLELYHHVSWPNIVIVDNSWHRDAFNNEEELRNKFGILKVLLTTTHLQFSGLMATIDALAASSGHDKYLWTHSDAAIISEDPQPFKMVKECIEKAQRKEDRLGVLFFGYDLLSMVKIEAGQKAPWDTALPQYGADCDRYARIRMAGYKTTDAPELCDLPSFKIFNMKAVLPSKELDILFSPPSETPFKYRLEVLQHANQQATSHGAWRHVPNDRTGMGKIDSEIMEANRRGGVVHYMNKWGGKKCGFGMPCNVKDEEKPQFDVPVVPIVGVRNEIHL